MYSKIWSFFISGKGLNRIIQEDFEFEFEIHLIYVFIAANTIETM
jgi:hypothetical protein